jgi:membrane associated rhomboid family serine protease
MFRRHDLDRDSLDFWRRQRRSAQRSRGRGSFPYGSQNRATIVLIAFFVLGLVLQYVLPIALIASLPLPQLWLALYSTILTGGLLGLVFAGLFVWIIGTQLEPLDATWKYMLLFFVSGTVGALAGDQLAGGLIGSVAAFGLAGAYAYVMYAHRYVDQAGVWRWVLGLLVLNALLSAFQPAAIVSMLTAFVAGFAFAYVTRFGG